MTTPPKSDGYAAPEDTRVAPGRFNGAVEAQWRGHPPPLAGRRAGALYQHRLPGDHDPAIASRAGVAEGTIYRHFSGKESLLNEAYREAQRWGTSVVDERAGDAQLSAADRLSLIATRIVEGAAQDPPLVRMLLRHRDDQHLDERSREASRQFRAALQRVVVAAKGDGALRSGPAELWGEVWLALVAFAAERVGTGEWTPESPTVALTLTAAWDAIAARA